MDWQSLVYLLVWAGLFAFMMRFGCGAHVMGNRHGRDHNKAGQTDGHAATQVARSEFARDPVCGMKVSTAEAKTSVYRGEIHYFCSQSCREKFEAEPARYPPLMTRGPL